jgi:hypothetical protein
LAERPVLRILEPEFGGGWSLDGRVKTTNSRLSGPTSSAAHHA